MDQLLGLAGTLFDLMLVVLGFGFIIFIHELGHFLAAKWAGIRVLAFAIGFGPAALSYRKGLGFRRGSSEREYQARLNAIASGATTIEGDRSTHHSISATEYRLNWLPLGGYVKMLGQDDMDPTAISNAPDSYQRCKPWKRMVVISAGVVMNLILAAVLFVGVFMHGLETEPAKVGAVRPGSPAWRATPVGGGEPGLKAGDVILSVNGRKPNSFNDLILATAMTSRGASLNVHVKRGGETLEYDVRPEIGDATGLQEIGIEPPRTNKLLGGKTAADIEAGRKVLVELGFKGVDPAMTLVRVAGKPVSLAEDANIAVRQADGKPVEAVFEGPGGKRAAVEVQPEAELQTGRVALGKNMYATIEHLLGLTPVMKVAPSPGLTDPRQGLQDNDIFARVGPVEFPSIVSGRSEIGARSGKKIEVSVLRAKADGTRELVKLDPAPTVKSTGKIGFAAGDTADTDTVVALPPAKIIDAHHPGDGAAPAAARLITRPGTRITAVAGVPVSNFTQIRSALRAATREAHESGAASVTVPMTLKLPSLSESPAITETRDWTLTRDEVRDLYALGWRSKLEAGLFEPEEFTLKAKGPIDAMAMGLSETKRVMMSTYITFARLFEGTVKVEHLKGPVGIAHMGTRIAERGIIWLFFFMALISVNLAVINFLPMPIVDGGQFLFLVVEQVRGKPVPIAIQNIATIAGLILIGTMFIIVTFHDVVNLFNG